MSLLLILLLSCIGCESALYCFFPLNRVPRHIEGRNWEVVGFGGASINIVRSSNYTFDGETIAEVDGSIVSAQADKTYPIEKFPIIPLLLQTGYLTIKEYVKHKKQFVLTYPNYEVQESFLALFAQELADMPEGKFTILTHELKTSLQSLNFEEFFSILKTFFSNIPYDIHIPIERYYQSLFYIILKLIGAHIIVEQRTNIGRIDAVIETDQTIIITEFKINSSAQSAIKQILTKKYYEPYIHSHKHIILLGVSFNTHEKNIEEWALNTFL